MWQLIVQSAHSPLTHWNFRVCPKCFHWTFSDKKNYFKKIAVLKPTISCVRGRDFITVPQIHSSQRRQLNWSQFMLQWIHWIRKIQWILFNLGKTPLVDPLRTSLHTNNIWWKFALNILQSIFFFSQQIKTSLQYQGSGARPIAKTSWVIFMRVFKRKQLDFAPKVIVKSYKAFFVLTTMH